MLLGVLDGVLEREGVTERVGGEEGDLLMVVLRLVLIVRDLVCEDVKELDTPTVCDAVAEEEEVSLEDAEEVGEGCTLEEGGT